MRNRQRTRAYPRTSTPSMHARTQTHVTHIPSVFTWELAPRRCIVPSWERNRPRFRHFRPPSSPPISLSPTSAITHPRSFDTRKNARGERHRPDARHAAPLLLISTIIAVLTAKRKKPPVARRVDVIAAAERKPYSNRLIATMQDAAKRRVRFPLSAQLRKSRCEIGLLRSARLILRNSTQLFPRFIFRKLIRYACYSKMYLLTLTIYFYYILQLSKNNYLAGVVF